MVFCLVVAVRVRWTQGTRSVVLLFGGRKVRLILYDRLLALRR